MKTKAERLGGGRKRPNHLSFSESSRVLSKETFSTCEMCDMVLKMTVISPPSRHASGAKRNFKALSAWVNFTGDMCCRWLTCQLDCDDRAGQERGGRQWRKRSQILIKKFAIVQSLYCLSKLCWARIQNKGLTKRFIHPLKMIHFQMRHGRHFLALIPHGQCSMQSNM